MIIPISKSLIPTPYLGTNMEEMAWTHASSFVTDQISIMLSLPESRHQYLELNTHFCLSLADGIVLVRCLGLKKAAEFVGSVDPWLYPDGKTPGPGCRTFTQSAVDTAAVAGKLFFKWTEESKSAYLLSPLLVHKGERPKLFRLNAAHDASCGSTVSLVDVACHSSVLLTKLPPTVSRG